VTYTPDPARGGVPAPGLVGRLYLFGPNVDFPKVGDGGVVVDLYNETPAADGKSHVLLEQWRFDPDTLKRLLKRDMIGWGYTLFLPWGTCSPAVTHVQLQLRYEPRKGAPLFAPPISLTLEHAPPAGPAAEPVAQRGPVPPRPAAADQSSGKPAGLIPAAGRHARNEVTGAGEPSRPSLRSGPGHPE
jgi:hypothetical protein